ncbi:MAG: DUF2520 domain-containing protein [Deltaproteobacteria bacterium]|nr:DUF2520 domain-containing protein [Myxococcales bacterium]MDP3212667.1 DUF2520 domain-containing protein [Deltaproteobacteria bacterium]
MTAPWMVLGLGRMGSAFVALARTHAVPVVGYASRGAPPERLREESVVWLLAVSDRAITDVCKSIAPALRPGDVVLHLAGARGVEVLDPARAAGASVGALHPLAAIATRTPAGSLAGAAFLVEGDPGAVQVARDIAALAGGRLVVAAGVDRARYHAGAALVASGAVAIAQGAAWLLADAVDPTPSEGDLRAATASLLVSVARNIEQVGPDAALASPLLRDDTETVARHLAVMAGDPTVRALYRAVLARVLVPLERGGQVRPETIAAAKALAEDPSGTH